MSSNDSEKIVPPKKSKAARKTEEKKDDASSNHEDDAADKVKESDAEKNIFNEEPILEGKRKRNSPASEQFLREWLLKSLVEAEVSQILFTSDIYKCYVESCTSSGGTSLLEGEFLKILNSIFPKGYALAPGCPYKDAVRKKKVQKNAGAVKAESLQLKMKDIIMEAIVALGNPRRGVSMNSMRNFVSGKYPALRLDQREGSFKKVINNLLRFNKLDCVRGIGACGFYRLPRTPEEEAEEIAKEKEEAKEKLKKKKEKQVSLKKKQEEGKTDGEVAEEKVTEVELGEENEVEKTNKDGAEGEAEGISEEAAEKLPDEKNEEVVIKPDENNDKKAKKTKKKVPKKSSNSGNKEHADFENPARIEDTFPLAMTYNCEPKEASIAKITKYVTDFYHQDLTNKEKLKKCLESGAEKGYWSQVTGTGSGNGTYRLTIEEFDPNSDSDLTGMIMNAIVACTEPKVSSAFLLKKYIQEYHPGLKVLEQPRKFKQALHRAISSNKIKQLSGIGASGSFQLLVPFRPSPSVLQGKESSAGHSGSSSEGGAGSDVEDGGLELFQDAYRPRPSKRKGMGRAVQSTKVARLDLSSYPSLKKAKNSNGTTSRRSATQGRGRLATAQKKGVKRPAYEIIEEDEEEEEEADEDQEESEPDYDPKKSQGSPVATRKGGKKSAIAVTNKKKTQVAKRPNKVTSKVTKGTRGTPAAKKAKLSKDSEKLEERAAKRRVSYAEAEDDMDDDEGEEEDGGGSSGGIGKSLNMASSPRSGAKKVGKFGKSSASAAVQQFSIVLEREPESRLSKAKKAGSKIESVAKGGASGGALANGKKASPGKGKKSLKKKKKKKFGGRY